MLCDARVDMEGVRVLPSLMGSGSQAAKLNSVFQPRIQQTQRVICTTGVGMKSSIPLLSFPTISLVRLVDPKGHTTS